MLSPKQQRFVEEYLVDLNATAAYKRAGYKGTGRSAENAASRLLGNVGVREAIAARQNKRSIEADIDSKRILTELVTVGLSDIGAILDVSGDDPVLRPMRDIPAKAWKSISSVKVSRYREGRGDDARTVEVTEFKMWSKLEALKMLGQHLGLFKQTDSRDLTDADIDRRIADLERRMAEAARGEATPADDEERTDGS